MHVHDGHRGTEREERHPAGEALIPRPPKGAQPPADRWDAVVPLSGVGGFPAKKARHMSLLANKIELFSKKTANN